MQRTIHAKIKTHFFPLRVPQPHGEAEVTLHFLALDDLAQDAGLLAGGVDGPHAPVTRGLPDGLQGEVEHEPQELRHLLAKAQTLEKNPF